MVRATSVFTPTDIPTVTYVERKDRNFEADLRRAFDIPKMIVSVSGPSKSGKTTLIRKVVSQDNLIHIYGANIKAPDDLWMSVMAWMGGSIEITNTSASKTGGTVSVSGGGEIGIPFVAKGQGSAQGAASHESSSSTSTKVATSLLDQIVKEIANSDFVVFIDDFHYIDRSVCEEIGKQVKAAAELGVRICTASVPHRSDDVVRSNTELRGRVTAIDMSYWSVGELEEIAYRGFRELNVDLASTLLNVLAREAFGSPQLMQAICLNFCFEMNIGEQLKEQVRIVEDAKTIRKVLERTSTTTDFSTMLTALHAGPKQRGTERKRFRFGDNTTGDVYRCVLLAIKEDPPALALSYEQILSRSAKICLGDSPVGSSLSESLKQMDGLAKLVQTAPVIEWDENVLDIVEPYFLFFLRCSPFIQKLAEK
jgi:hypothetical protein